MGNITNNRINTTISEADMATIKAKMDELVPLLPAFGLTPKERKTYKSISVANRAFVEDCIMEIQSNGAEILPPYIKPQDLVNDFMLFKQLHELKTIFKQGLEIIEAAHRIASNEAVDVSMTIYGLYETAAKSGIAGAKSSYDHLAERFEKNKGRKPHPPVVP